MGHTFYSVFDIYLKLCGNNYQLECKIWLDKVYFILCPQKFNDGLTHYKVAQDLFL